MVYHYLHYQSDTDISKVSVIKLKYYVTIFKTVSETISMLVTLELQILLSKVLQQWDIKGYR